MTELAYSHAKGSFLVQELPCPKRKCWLAFMFLFLSFFFFFLNGQTERGRLQSKKNPINLKPILILAESNNNDLRCLTLLNANPIPISVPLETNEQVHPTIPYPPQHVWPPVLIKQPSRDLIICHCSFAKSNVDFFSFCEQTS